MTPRNLDVSGLPDVAFGHRTLAFWGTLGFIAVEATFFAVMIASYLYGMARAPLWPPAVEPPDLRWGVLNTVILVLNAIPNALYKRAAERLEAKRARLWLTVAAIIGSLFLGVRVLEFTTLHVRWDHSFYGSMVWTLLGFHTLHILSDVVETWVLVVMCYRLSLNDHRLSDLVDNAMYWYFVLAAWLPVFGLIYLVPRFV